MSGRKILKISTLLIISLNHFPVFLFSVNSTVLSQEHPIDPDANLRPVNPAILPRTLKCGPVITTCGHVMHAKCYQTMFDNLVKQQIGKFKRSCQNLLILTKIFVIFFIEEHGLRTNFNINNQEYNCPICQRLSNSVLPISKVVLPGKLGQKSPSSNFKNFKQWQNKMSDLVMNGSQIDTKKKIKFPADDLTKFSLKDQLTILNEKVPIDETLATMSSTFALNVMNVSKISKVISIF